MIISLLFLNRSAIRVSEVCGFLSGFSMDIQKELQQIEFDPTPFKQTPHDPFAESIQSSTFKLLHTPQEY